MSADLDTCDRCGKAEERIHVGHAETLGYDGLCEACYLSLPETGGGPGAQAGASAPEQGPVDTFTRRRLSLDDLRERAALPGGHRDRMVLVATMWSDWRVLTPWYVLEVTANHADTPLLRVRLHGDRTHSATTLVVSEIRVYGLAEDGV